MFKFVVVRQAWVEDGQTKAWFQNGRQRRGRGADAGRSRADDEVVPGRMAESGSWSRRGSKPGRRRQRRGSRTDVDWSGRGHWDKTETIADVDTGTETETEKAWKHLRDWEITQRS